MEAFHLPYKYILISYVSARVCIAWKCHDVPLPSVYTPSSLLFLYIFSRQKFSLSFCSLLVLSQLSETYHLLPLLAVTVSHNKMVGNVALRTHCILISPM